MVIEGKELEGCGRGLYEVTITELVRRLRITKTTSGSLIRLKFEPRGPRIQVQSVTNTIKP
jgi:hypothetical protein